MTARKHALPFPIFFFLGLGVFIAAGAVWWFSLRAQAPQRTFCNNTGDDYQCVTDEAKRTQDPSLCYTLDASSSDRCVDETMPFITDSAACQKIPQWTIRRRCLDRF